MNIKGILILAVVMAFALGCAYAGQRQTGSEAEDQDARKIGAYRELNEQERYILLQRGTERPFTGEYNSHYEPGTYHCRQCDSPLYTWATKFDSGTGWPSFDQQIPGSVLYLPDPDGRRTETVCSYCGGHLGHVFYGEGLTENNTRYCINSAALHFKPYASAVFAGGCFWGVEYLFEELDGVINAVSGYTGGTLADPSYREVISGITGHVEAVKVTYDHERISYRDLAMFFFEIHDPTQKDGQGPDIGEQYMSVIFYSSEQEKHTAEELISILRDKGYDVVTDLRPRVIFWPAEEYHQDYYRKQQTLPYCHYVTPRF